MFLNSVTILMTMKGSRASFPPSELQEDLEPWCQKGPSCLSSWQAQMNLVESLSLLILPWLINNPEFFSVVDKLLSVRVRFSLCLCSKRGTCIHQLGDTRRVCSAERHWGGGLGDIVGGWPDIFHQFSYLNGVYWNKSEDAIGEGFPGGSG